MSSPTLTVVIVSYNVCGDLRECLQSVYASEFDGGLQVVVVDNASSDDTTRMVRQGFPRVDLICNDGNVGFPKANNQGVAIAKGAFILFLNPDTVVMPDTLSACVRFLRDNPGVGLLGCKVRYPDGAIQYECARNFPSLTTMVWEALYLHMLFPTNRYFGRTLMGNWDHEDSRDVPCVLGAFMLLPQPVLAALGGMDETVFMFMEDIDLCYRVGKTGRRVFYFADATIVHKAGRSQESYVGSLKPTNAEAKYAFFRKHAGATAAATCRTIFLMQSMFRLALSVALLPMVSAFPRTKRALRGSWVIGDHWQLLRWALGYPTRPEGAS